MMHVYISTGILFDRLLGIPYRQSTFTKLFISVFIIKMLICISNTDLYADLYVVPHVVKWKINLS